MELPYGHTTYHVTHLCRRNAHGQCRLALLSQFLHLQLLHGLLGLGTLATGTRLDGTPWHQHAAGHHRHGVCVEGGADEGLWLYARRGQHFRLRQRLLRLVLHEQPHGMGRPATRELVRPATDVGTQDFPTHERLRYAACHSRVCGHDSQGFHVAG